ncbi:MAG: hypothetical protein ACLPPV_00100 [Candidatus Korobacteraceae bacterium]
MDRLTWWMRLCIVVGVCLPAIDAAAQQVQLVDVVPALYSNETNTDSEPNVAVNPANPMDVVVTAFTPCPSMISTTDAPIYFSTDGGSTWQLNCIFPGNDPTFGTNDGNIRFAGAGGVLYAGILTAQVFLQMDILRTADFTSPVEMTTLVSRGPEDQPYTAALGYYGDHVYVGNNNVALGTFEGGTSGKTASVDWSTDAATAPAPAGFGTNVLETRDTCGQDPPPIRPAVHINGTVYVVYYRNQTGSPCFAGSNTVDVVVARDDNWGSGGYSAIIDSDGKAGIRVVQGVSVVWAGAMGNERLQGSQLSIAVDPNDSNTVYVSWADGTSANYTLHVRHSTNGGTTWDSSDLIAVMPADNPALAINKDGIVGFLYQKYVSSGTCHTGGGSAACWETHFETYNGSTWTDLATPLANTPDNAGGFPLGDYEHVMAVGRDFYGAFSASNYPDTANFYAGVQYQRYADWSAHKLYADAGHTMPVSASVDPFFFHISELQPYQEFYVRDWTDSPSSHDNGEEPSTNGNWWTTSDVWNRLTNTNGGFNANDQPNSQNAQDHVSVTAHNYAFVRVHRNQAAPGGSGNVNVTARFLYADYGLGVPYQNVSATPTATLTFMPSDTVVTLADGAGVQWDLPLMRSTHICLAVEISAPNDSYSPELAGRAPGWPTTDWTIPADNEKAQRNMDLPPMAAASTGSMSFHPIVHNAAPFTRDMILQYSVPPEVLRRLDGPQIGVVGSDTQAMRSEGTLVLPNMQPGENRWLDLTYSAANAQIGESLPITVKEFLGDAELNGITIAAQPVPVSDMILNDITMHRGAFARLDVSFQVPNAKAQSEVAAKLLSGGSVSDAQYTDFLNQNLTPIEKIVAELLQSEKTSDSFGLKPALANLQTSLSGGDVGLIANTHAALLNKLDAFQTMLQKQEGDPTDILQMVVWQKRLYSTVPRLTSLKAARHVIEESDKFIKSYNHPGPHEETYSRMLLELGGALHETAEALECDKMHLEPLVDAIEHRLNQTGPLEKAHRAFLLELQSICPTMVP